MDFVGVCMNRAKCEIVAERYEILEKIGSGGFSDVFRVKSLSTGKELALKKVSISEERRAALTKEVIIHQRLCHPNIIEFHEAFEEKGHFYIIQELAFGGELFELVEPDSGFPEQVVHFYFVQLMNAIKYLQSQGVCHRDLKLENLLIDGHGNLKVADFGLSSIYKKDGKRRLMNTRCGTPAYMAPEVLLGKEYDGDFVDLWAAAIILVALFCGNLPWDNASGKCKDFVEFVKKKTSTCISRIPEAPRKLVVGMLQYDPKSRIRLADIVADSWFNQRNPLLDKSGACSDASALFQLIRANSSTQLSCNSPFALTQPDPVRHEFLNDSDCLSQPDSSASFQFSRECFGRLTLHCSALQTIRKIESILKSMLVPFKLSPELGQILFQTVDSRKCPLSGTISVQALADQSLITVRKTRGNPLEYARFLKFLVEQINS